MNAKQQAKIKETIKYINKFNQLTNQCLINNSSLVCE